MRTETYYTPGAVRLNLDLPVGAIEITAASTEDTRIELEALSRNDQVREFVEAARIDLVKRGDVDEVLVEVQMRHGFLISFGRGPDMRLRITCPLGAELDIRTKSADVDANGQFGAVEVKTASGDINVEEPQGRVRIKTASGDVSVEHAHSSLDVQSASGDLHAGAVDGELRVQLVSGDLKVGDVHGDSVRANTVSGDQRLEAVERGRIDLRSVSGDVAVGVRRGSRLYVDANTVSGSTSSELELSDAPTQVLSDDAPLVELFVKTVSGDVRLERAPARSAATEVTSGS
jgi:DUF4097 and DUF4098 domain-containing protein YvlB